MARPKQDSSKSHVTSVRCDPELLEIVRRGGHSLSEAAEIGLKILSGLSDKSLEEMKIQRDRLIKEYSYLESQINILNEKIEAEESRLQEVDKETQEFNQAVEQAVSEISEYTIDSYYKRDYDIIRVRFLAKKHGISPDTIIGFINNKADDDEIRATIKAQIQADE